MSYRLARINRIPLHRALHTRTFSSGPVGLADDSLVERADFISSDKPLLLDAKKHAVGYLVSFDG